MSDETDHEHTHRVVGKAHRRTTESDTRPGSAAVYEPGEPITPTARELESLPGRFERVVDESDEATQGDESGETAAESEPTETTDDDADGDTATESDESDKLTPEAVEAADYNGLRGMATEYDEISGNWGADRLRAELLDRVSD